MRGWATSGRGQSPRPSPLPSPRSGGARGPPPLLRPCAPDIARPMSKKPEAAFAHLGKPSQVPAAPDAKTLDRAANPQADTGYVVRFVAPEFTSICPVTGQPDHAHLVIDYAPAKWILEFEIAEALSHELPQPRRLSRGLHGQDRQGYRCGGETPLAQDRRLLVSARRHPDRRLLADRASSERLVDSGARRRAVPRARVARETPSPALLGKVEADGWGVGRGAEARRLARISAGTWP